jgi:hypothetical protein
MSDSMPLKMRKRPPGRRVEPIDLSLLLLDFLDREAAGVMRRLRVIADANVLVAEGEAGLGHCFKRIGTVRGGSVGVQNPE